MEPNQVTRATAPESAAPLPSASSSGTQAAAPSATRATQMRRLGLSWQECFFKQDDGDVWVQNLTDMQISLDIETGNGQSQGKLIPPSPDPLNLTEEFAFEALKKSNNFRKTVAKRVNGRPQLILLTAEQVDAYYEAKARAMGAVYADGTANIDAALDAAEQTRRKLTTREVDGEHVNASNLQGFAPPKSAQELIAIHQAQQGIQAGPGMLRSTREQAGMAFNAQQGGILMEEVVNPKVLHLCQQVNPQIPVESRMPAADFFSALQTMQANLRLEDYQHIESHGTYRTVKTWARQQIARMSTADEGLPDNLSLAGQSLVAQADQRGALQGAVLQPQPHTMQPQPHTMQPQYQGPTGFVNAPMQGAHGSAEAMVGTVLGPDGQPL